MDAYRALDLANLLFKTTVALALASAYTPKLKEAMPDEGDVSTDPANGDEEIANRKAACEQDCDDDDDDEEPKKQTAYNWPAIALRFKRLMPLALPHGSRLAYVLVGEQLKLRTSRCDPY